MLICFNIGIMVVGSLGIYQGVDYGDSVEENYFDEEEYYKKNIEPTTDLLGILGLTAGGLAFGGLLGYVSSGGVDVLRFAGITGFAGFVIGLLATSRGLLHSIGAQLSGNSSTVGLVIDLFLFFELVMVAFFIWQMATGGWANAK